MNRARALDESAAKRLVDTWLAAQNQGDFSAYQGLYAPRFTGVKRAGKRETTFDREGWLADRKAMFEKPMRVEAAKLELSVTPGGANAELEQTWSSATYRDVGVKRLVIVPTPAGPRIAREEMLSSLVAGAEARPTATDVLAVHRDGVILSNDAEDSWASGPHRVDIPNHVVARDVDESKLPSRMRGWKGRAVRAFSADGSACDAKLVGFAVRAEVVPHFGMVNHWQGREGTAPASANEIAEQLWELTEHGGRVLVGKLEPACSGALWALPAEKTLPLVAKRVDARPALREAAVKAFRALPSYEQIQKEFAGYGKSAPWETSEPDALRVAVFQASDKPALVSVAAKAGNGCGDFYGELSALFAPRPGAPHELELVDEPNALEPLAAFTLAGSGSYELLFAPEPASDERSLWRRDERGRATLTELFTIPFLDCPC